MVALRTKAVRPSRDSNPSRGLAATFLVGLVLILVGLPAKRGCAAKRVPAGMSACRTFDQPFLRVATGPHDGPLHYWGIIFLLCFIVESRSNISEYLNKSVVGGFVFLVFLGGFGFLFG